jgi:hypothetical protein
MRALLSREICDCAGEGGARLRRGLCKKVVFASLRGATAAFGI